MSWSITFPFRWSSILFLQLKNNHKSWDNWMLIYKRITLVSYFTTFIKFNSNWISDLNIKAQAMKALEGNRGFETLSLAVGFLAEAQRDWVTKTIGNEWNFIEKRNLWASKALWRKQRHNLYKIPESVSLQTRRDWWLHRQKEEWRGISWQWHSVFERGWQYNSMSLTNVDAYP